MTDLQYPIGKRPAGQTLTPELRRAAIKQIADMPAILQSAVTGLTREQLDTPYRPGGWTVRQVVHHLADSHMILYGRFKLALTEDEPVVKPYAQTRWAEMPDSLEGPVEMSTTLLQALHQRFVLLLEAMRPEEFARRLNHSERGLVSLDEMLALCAWHGRHHVAHITSLRERTGWR